MSLVPVPLWRPMTGRDRHEAGRAATPLELLFDLVFVVAIASDAAYLHHGLSAGDWGALSGYTLTWFGIWWAWVSYTWFASAYDTDDVVFRVLSLVVMTGALMFAAAVPELAPTGQSVMGVAGYAVMRFGQVGLWLRAAADDPERRRTALTYAVLISLVQVLWVGRLWLPASLSWSFFVLVGLELLVPVVAESRGNTPYHPHHIAERFGLLAIIALGEVVLSTVQSIQQAIASAAPAEGGAGHTAPYAAAGVGWDMLPLVIGGLLVVYSTWWLYFKTENASLLQRRPWTAWVFSYGHLPVYASIAAIGAALSAAIDVTTGAAAVSSRPVAVALAAAVAVTVLGLAGIHAVCGGSRRVLRPAALVAVAALGSTLVDASMPFSVLLVGLPLAGAVAEHVRRSTRGTLGSEP
ncbi:MAG: low temperature requirement protein A [Dermatophilaceae bacterium]